MSKLLFAAAAVVLAVAVFVPVSVSSASAAACLISGRVFSGRCPDHVAVRGYDGRLHWRRNRVYCVRYGRFSHWGHC
jgi:hypothetical protein